MCNNRTTQRQMGVLMDADEAYELLNAAMRSIAGTGVQYLYLDGAAGSPAEAELHYQLRLAAAAVAPGSGPALELRTEVAEHPLPPREAERRRETSSYLDPATGTWVRFVREYTRPQPADRVPLADMPDTGIAWGRSPLQQMSWPALRDERPDEEDQPRQVVSWPTDEEWKRYRHPDEESRAQLSEAPAQPGEGRWDF